VLKISLQSECDCVGAQVVSRMTDDDFYTLAQDVRVKNNYYRPEIIRLLENAIGFCAAALAKMDVGPPLPAPSFPMPVAPTAPAPAPSCPPNALALCIR